MAAQWHRRRVQAQTLPSRWCCGSGRPATEPVLADAQVRLALTGRDSAALAAAVAAVQEQIPTFQ